MNKEELKACVWHHMLTKARDKIQKIEMDYVVSTDTVYSNKFSDVIINRKDIAAIILSNYGINPLNFDEIEWTSNLDVFKGTLFDGDNPDGDGPEWFTVECESRNLLHAKYTKRIAL